VEHNKKQKDVLPSQLAANLFSEVVNPMDEAAAMRSMNDNAEKL
jgi:hypothetical protein